MSQDEIVKEVLRRFARAYERKDLPAMRELFAQDGGLVFYGTQANLHFVGWDAVEGSLRRQFAVLEAISLRYRDMHVRLLAGGGAACVATLLDYDATLSGAPLLAAGIRVTCSLDRAGDRFQIVHMHWSLARPEVLVQH
jgi:ketosteroid isomerase-like protein